MPPSLKDQVDALLSRIETVIADAEAVKGRRVSPEQRESLVEKSRELKRALDASVYPHPLPSAVFDPSNTRLFGRFAAIALAAQDRVALADVEHVYGSGVYALYYSGSFAQYTAVANTETPLYVGKAQPSEGAVLPVEQGTAVTSRLREHRRSITYATNLDVADFECRFLVIAAGWETPAELELIRYFCPLWNEGIGPVHGLGKHGDSPTTRANGRSPWDTLHPGRPWATNIKQDQMTRAAIKAAIAAHLSAHKPVKTRQAVIDAYVDMLASTP
ncbi:Eco29kI family restriction endonuclease [Mycobacteroides chelonae]|uniref:Eco29kI family restriction endonuclease n=1 Tax=Mycobacteroides chelonae TaxID=1774 RepID=UPI001C489613|nr:Eco29kI family restriction endonuclease [Mycobacteroides chelonae]MBV6362747.1 Eco29kI family restriction endonuclease [Mycobacteroides chelonae]